MHYGWITLTQLQRYYLTLCSLFYIFFFKSVLFPPKLVFKYKCIGMEIHHQITHRTLLALHNAFDHFHYTVHYIRDLVHILDTKQC